MRRALGKRAEGSSTGKEVLGGFCDRPEGGRRGKELAAEGLAVRSGDVSPERIVFGRWVKGTSLVHCGRAPKMLRKCVSPVKTTHFLVAKLVQNARYASDFGDISGRYHSLFPR